MTQDVAQMRITQKRNSLGRLESMTFEWVGSSPYMKFSSYGLKSLGYVDFPEAVQIGPYHLLKVEHVPAEDMALYVRRDRLGQLRVWLYRATRWLDLIYRRLIITLAVWELADFRAGSVPDWTDIHLLKKFKRGSRW